MTLTTLCIQTDTIENIVGIGENTGSQHLFFFHQCFLPFSDQISFSDIYFVVCKCLEFGTVQNFVVWLRVQGTKEYDLRQLGFYFMLSDRISRNIGENIFRSYTGTTSENTDFHVLVA